MTASVLLVEDEDSFIDALVVGLTREGFDVSVARDGVEALERFDDAEPDIVLLDLMLPRLSGIDVCRELRTKSVVPIIMVTARDSESDVEAGMNVGANDYVSKPFRLAELLARIRLQLRPEHRAEEFVLRNGDLSLDLKTRQATVSGKTVDLSSREFALAELFLRHCGQVLAVAQQHLGLRLRPDVQRGRGLCPLPAQQDRRRPDRHGQGLRIPAGPRVWRELEDVSGESQRTFRGPRVQDPRPPKPTCRLSGRGRRRRGRCRGCCRGRRQRDGPPRGPCRCASHDGSHGRRAQHEPLKVTSVVVVLHLELCRWQVAWP